MPMKNIVSGQGVGRRREVRVKHIKGRQEGGIYGDVDGWIVHGSAEKVEQNKREEKKKKPVNLCLVNLPILAAGSLSPATETI